MSSEPVQQPVLYQADPNFIQSAKNVCDRIHEMGRHYMNHPVRVQTAAGHVHEGMIVNVDNCYLYLAVPAHSGYQRQWFNPWWQQAAYNNVILPLVLYELLVITLLYT
jgi:hypothetical protein